jgi:DNA-binding IclR family transcriptional regulator
MPELLFAAQCIEYARSFVLPLLRLLQRQRGKGVKAGMLSEHLGLQRRQTYNYLRALEIAGLARLEGKLWKVA